MDALPNLSFTPAVGDMPFTPKQRSLLSLASELGRKRFAPRAAQWDETASFPFANYDDLRDAGLVEREGRFERRGQQIAKLAVDGATLKALLTGAGGVAEDAIAGACMLAEARVPAGGDGGKVVVDAPVGGDGGAGGTGAGGTTVTTSTSTVTTGPGDLCAQICTFRSSA